MASRGPSGQEDLVTWRTRAEAELSRLRSLADAQLGAEVMRRGFAELTRDGARTRIGLSESLCPTAPRAVGEDDIDVVAQFDAMLVPVLGALEAAGLLGSEPRGRSGLRFYAVTTRGWSALRDDDVEAVLSAGPGRAAAGDASPATARDRSQD